MSVYDLKKTSQRQIETNLKLEKLFSAALQGDEGSYHDFLTEVSQIIRVFLARLLTGNDKSDLILEDLVQEVLITIHNKRHLYKTGMPLLPWLKVITRHRLVDSVRSSKRIPDLVVFDENFTYAVEESLDASAVDTESLLQPLDERHLKVLLMAKVDQLSHAEIAASTGMSIASVKVTVHRALKTIRNDYNENR